MTARHNIEAVLSCQMPMKTLTSTDALGITIRSYKLSKEDHNKGSGIPQKLRNLPTLSAGQLATRESIQIY